MKSKPANKPNDTDRTAESGSLRVINPIVNTPTGIN